MHARVTFAQVRPGELHETMGLLRESLFPALKQMKGFKGALLLTNPNTEKFIGIALWETEADIPHIGDVAVETRGPGRGTRRFFEVSPLERLAMIPLVGQATREIYEVSVQVEATSGGESMHAIVSTRQIQSGRMDEAVRILRDQTLPIMEERNGFKGGLVLADRSADNLMTISLWETEADSRANEPPGFVDVVATGGPTREVYEVTDQL